MSELVGGGVAVAVLSDLVRSGFGRESLSFLYFLSLYILTMIHALTMIHIIASIVDRYSFGYLAIRQTNILQSGTFVSVASEASSQSVKLCSAIM